LPFWPSPACNTAHYYYPDIQAAVRIPVINLVRLVVDTVIARVPGLHQAGVLATPAIQITRLYEIPFAARGVKTIYPSPVEQERLFALVKGVKTGKVGPDERAVLGDIVKDVAARGAEVGIIACTELGVIAGNEHALPVFDAAEILAEEIVAVVKHGKPL
jgi:aspartate racemase